MTFLLWFSVRVTWVNQLESFWFLRSKVQVGLYFIEKSQRRTTISRTVSSTTGTRRIIIIEQATDFPINVRGYEVTYTAEKKNVEKLPNCGIWVGSSQKWLFVVDEYYNFWLFNNFSCKEIQLLYFKVVLCCADFD